MLPAKPDRRELLARAALYRERATIARRLAAELTEKVARQGLLDRAALLEGEAAALEAEIAE